MNRLTLLLPVLSTLLVAQAPAPQGATGKEEDELLALLNTPITVASKKALTTRESPSVVSLVTREEIQASGARDLIDVLRLVPGFDIGYDVQGVTGPSLRGLWGYEGKILLLWDGVEMNETLYGTTQLGNHYPVDQIKRVEIIRGPGSSIYGGYAEVAVIQITSLGPEDLPEHVGAGLFYGKGKDATYRQGGHLLAGTAGDGFKLTFGAFAGDGKRSDGDYTDPTGTTFSLKDNSKIRPLFANLGLTAGDFSFRGIVDQYFMEQRDNLPPGATPTATGIRFGSTNLEAKYAWKVSKDLLITPFVLWRDQKPWWVADPSAGTFMISSTRTRIGVGLAWDINAAFDLAAGLETQKDTAESIPPTGTFLNGTYSVDYTSKAAYGQLAYQGPVNITVGARWEDHSEVGSAFVPRFALTKTFGKWHFKLLYANAFRTPAIQNINQAADPVAGVEPEKTRTAEVEAGVQFGANLVTVNVFDTLIKKPLVYLASTYFNGTQIGTRGAEVEWKTRQSWGFMTGNLTWFKASGNDVPQWGVPGHDSELLGSSSTKATLAGGIKLPAGFNLGPSLIWFSERYGYVATPGVPGLTLEKLPSDFLVNLNLSWTRAGLRADLGLFDAGDRRRPFVQAYDGGFGPLPGTGRELTLKLRYGF
ncbi:MAG TPA: TonB-dependent receptor plug domain-containing protein [Holophagaceae bacterium]|nr:TonB-dependent receptor plug domain-containing protein [Holophagaceae bacterium]